MTKTDEFLASKRIGDGESPTGDVFIILSLPSRKSESDASRRFPYGRVKAYGLIEPEWRESAI